MVHHPYESSTWWCSSCARRRAIPTSSRSSRRSIAPADSPIVSALVEAAEPGKSVTALIELKARFDEEANIRWARDLERAGAQVVFGFIELKTHAKLSMVVRREGGALRHLLPCRHRQLSSGDGADLHRYFLFHRRSGDRARRFAHLQLHHRLCRAGGARAHGGLADLAQANAARAYRGGNRPRERRQAGGDLGQDATRSSIRRSSTRFTRRARPACRSISSCAASAACGRACRAFPTISGSNRSSAGSLNMRASMLRQRLRPAACQGRGLYFFRRSDAAQPRPARRGYVPIINPTVHEQVLDQIMVANLIDNQQSYRVLPDGSQHAHQRRPGEEPFNAHSYFMTNPSLSGRGKSLKNRQPENPVQAAGGPLNAARCPNDSRRRRLRPGGRQGRRWRSSISARTRFGSSPMRG